MNCIVNVTDREYDRILQMNHDAVVWSSDDRKLIQNLQRMFGTGPVAEMCQYDECRMEKHPDLASYRRIQPAQGFGVAEEENRATEARELQESVNVDLGVGD